MSSTVVSNRLDIPPSILDEGVDACELINGDGTSPLILVCEHASNFIPEYFGNFGLTETIQNSHVAWDPGAKALAIALSVALDAPLVCSNVSRLIYDCNRPPDASTAMPEKSEVFDIPGNNNIAPMEARARFEQVYQPFVRMLAETIQSSQGKHLAPVLVTIHSFTPIYHGVQRAVEIGILHGNDMRIADVMLAAAAGNNDFVIKRNQPYGPKDGVTHTLETHGEKNGLLNIMIEVRNDLLTDVVSVKRVAETLECLIRSGLKRLSDAKPSDTDHA